MLYNIQNLRFTDSPIDKQKHRPGFHIVFDGSLLAIIAFCFPKDDRRNSEGRPKQLRRHSLDSHSGCRHEHSLKVADLAINVDVRTEILVLIWVHVKMNAGSFSVVSHNCNSSKVFLSSRWGALSGAVVVPSKYVLFPLYKWKLYLGVYGSCSK